jgi:hypothetical protein
MPKGIVGLPGNCAASVRKRRRKSRAAPADAGETKPELAKTAK